MPILSDPSDLLVSEAQLLPLAETLNLPPDRLLGVSALAQAALLTLGVLNIFDLAMSSVFNAAAQIEDAADNPSNAMNRFGRPISDLLKPGISGTVAVPDLRNESIDILADIADAAAMQAALGVITVRDLSVYPPFRAAKDILKRVFFPEQLDAFDPESPTDLIPKSGEFPTERVQYKSLVLDQILRLDNAPPLIDLAGPNFAPIDASPVADANFGFNTLGLGMLLTLNQSWFMQGVTLGHLLHSMALAAGESTRIAVIDWSRKTSAGQTEVLGETEDLSQDASRNRSISEVTEAVAREAQSGFSHTESQSTTKQAGASGGFSIGPFGGGVSASISKTSTSADSYATSAGSREVGASMLQNASDRTHQHAHAARTRRASVVREVSQTEHESVSTRVVTNYNHMHALTVQYYEVLQVYRTETSLTRCDRVVFIPFKLLDFNNVDLLRRFRNSLIDAALTPAIRDALVNFDTLEFVPERQVVFPGLGGTITDALANTQVKARRVLFARRRNDNETGTETGEDGGDGPIVDPPPKPPRPPSRDDVADNLWENAASKLSAFFRTSTVRRGSQSLFVPSDVRVEEGAVQSPVRAIKLMFVLRDGTRITDLSTSIALAEVDRIAISGSDPAADVSATGVLALSRNGIVFPLELPTVTVARGAQETRLIDVRAAGADVNLVQHLTDNRLHYSRAVFQSLDSAMIAGLLSPYSITMNGQKFPLVQVAEPIPLRIVGNALAFKINTDPVNDAEWREFMASRGLTIGQAKVDIVPLSSGGIFAEAVLGRFNCAEKLDITRFFNWQDSPIPILPTEIAAIQTGTRGTVENLTPGQFSAPLVSITPPAALPDPTGLAGTLAAVQNGNLFRDMSGLAQTAALAQAALQASAAGATAVGDQAGQNLKTVMDNVTERERIKAQIASSGATGNRPAKNVTEEGARVNHARSFDARAASGTSAIGTADSSGTVNGGVIDSPSPQFGRSAEVTQPSIERDLFDRQTGGTAANLAKQVTPVTDEIPLAEGQRIDTSVAVKSRISELVNASGLPQFVWSAGDPMRRARAPIGYLKGMARTYARVYCNFKKEPRDQFADAMARGVAPGAPQLDQNGNFLDAVKKFSATFDAFGADVSVDGVDVLRAVFTILFSLGMRESDGKHCTGWDRGKLTGWGDPTKAIAATATNSEAGLFQISFDIGVGVPGDYQDLFTRYKQAPLSGFLNDFRKGVTCNAANWQNFGAAADEGFKFQKFSKECPAFTVELAALGIRVRANHWGPINTNRVEIVRPAWDLLLEIEKAMDELDGCIAVAM